jgi:hypothetical protein
MIWGKHNPNSGRRVYLYVSRTSLLGSLLLLGVTSGMTFDPYTSARQKVDLIEGGKLQAGARIDVSLQELNAFAAHEAPAGVRNVKLVLTEPDTVSASALVDFGKLRRGQGYEPGWLLSKLLDGERPITATARIRSGGGKVTVDVKQASISGVAMDGGTLDFLIQNFILPFYPEAIVGKPVEMGFHIDHLQLAAAGVGVTIGR